MSALLIIVSIVRNTRR